MIHSLVPVQQLDSIPIGYSKPQLILFSDGLKYVVKFKNNPTGTRVLVNEFVAVKTAQLLSLPVPPFQIVPISDAFIKETPALTERRFISGNQFASLYIEDCSFLSADFFRMNGLEILNREVFPGMILFDLWLCNTDRKEKNVLLKSIGNGTYYFYMIDHGRCFAHSNWTASSLKEINSRLDLKVHQWCFSLLQGRVELDYYLERILSLPDQKIHEIIHSIPQDWNVTAMERRALFAYLMSRRKMLPAILDEFIKKTGFA